MKSIYTFLWAVLLTLFLASNLNAQPTNGLVAHYPFNGDANDESGNGNDGIVNGAQLTADRFGNNNSSYSFVGEDDYIELENNVDQTNYFTLSAWVYLNEYNPNPYHLQYGGNTIFARGSLRYSGEWDYIFNVNGNHHLGFVEHPAYCCGYVIESDQDFPLNRWIHVVYVFDNGLAFLYQDGVQVAFRDDFQGGNTHQKDPTVIGILYRSDLGYTSEEWTGYLDDFRIYNYALSEGEIIQLYNEPNINSIQVIAPNGGEIYKKEIDDITITWETDNNYDSFVIELSTDGGNSWGTIGTMIDPTERNFIWQATPTFESRNCKIKIKGIGNSTNDTDESDNIFWILEPGYYFDDFNYMDITEIGGNGWRITDTISGPPDCGGMKYDDDLIVFGNENGASIMYAESFTSNNENLTKGSRIQNEKIFYEGTYAAKIRFDNATQDGNIQTFYTINNVSGGLPSHAECDFEYLPHDVWDESNPIDYSESMYLNTWGTNDKDFRESDDEEITLADWIILIIDVNNELVKYSIIDNNGNNIFSITHNNANDVYPDNYMQIAFANWIERDKNNNCNFYLDLENNPAGLTQMAVDWVVHINDASLYYYEIDEIISYLQQNGHSTLNYMPDIDIINNNFDHILSDIEYLLDDINVINNGQFNALTKKINEAIIKFNQGKINVAINKLNAFKNKVNGFKNGGILEASIANALIAETDQIISNMSLSKRGNELAITSQPLTNYYIMQNYPNPFNPSTVISYQIPGAGFVTLKVYDILGKKIATLVEGYKDEGKYEVNYDASNIPSGIYFYRLQSGSFVETKKMILLK